MGEVIRKFVKIAQPILAVLPVGKPDFSHEIVYYAEWQSSRGVIDFQFWMFDGPTTLLTRFAEELRRAGALLRSEPA